MKKVITHIIAQVIAHWIADKIVRNMHGLWRIIVHTVTLITVAAFIETKFA